MSDELSQDRQIWLSVSACTALLPAGLGKQSIEKDILVLLAARSEIDERAAGVSGTARNSASRGDITPARDERRKAGREKEIIGSLAGTLFIRSHRSRLLQARRTILLAALLATLVLAYFTATLR